MMKEKPMDITLWLIYFVFGVIAGKVLGWWILILALVFIPFIILSYKQHKKVIK